MARVFYDDELKDEGEAWMNLGPGRDGGADRIVLDRSTALCKMVMDGAVFFSAQDLKPCVICSDTFYYATADCEELPANQLERVYRMHEADKRWGLTKWCILQRKQAPLPPLVELMKKAGAWDAEIEAALAAAQVSP